MLSSHLIVRGSRSCSKVSLFSKCFSNNQTVLKGAIDPTNEEIFNGNIRSSNIKRFYETLMSQIFSGGGEKSKHRHTVTNKKMLVRNRLKMIFDADSPLLEFAPLAGIEMDYGSVPASGTVGMIGKIHGLYCFVGGNDATVKGGALYPISVVKGLRGQTLSVNNYLTSVIVVDSAGAFLPLQADIFPDRKHGGRTFRNQAVFSSIGIPQLSIVAGSCTAGGAYTPTMTEECIIVKDIGLIYLGGPPLVKAATGEIVTNQELGGAEMHSRFSGCTDFFAETETQAYQMCRDTILTLNLDGYETTVSARENAEPLYSKEELPCIAGKLVISKNDIYNVLARILDGSAFKEFKAMFGQHLITGFGYIHGHLVGIFSNSGYLSSADGEKGAHFIELCDRRAIPLIFLQNSGECGNDVFSDSGTVLKNRAKVITAVSCASVPKISINIGGCFEDDNFSMCGMSFKPNFVLSWPLAHSSLHPPSERRIMSAAMEYADYTDILFQDETSAFFKASRVEVDAIVLPEDTREVLKLCLEVIKCGQRVKQLASERKIKVPTFRM